MGPAATTWCQYTAGLTRLHALAAVLEAEALALVPLRRVRVLLREP